MKLFKGEGALLQANKILLVCQYNSLCDFNFITCRFILFFLFLFILFK